MVAGCWWWFVGGWCPVVVGWWVMVGAWLSEVHVCLVVGWLVVGGCLVVGEWWLVISW